MEIDQTFSHRLCSCTFGQAIRVIFVGFSCVLSIPALVMSVYAVSEVNAPAPTPQGPLDLSSLPSPPFCPSEEYRSETCFMSGVGEDCPYYWVLNSDGKTGTICANDPGQFICKSGLNCVVNISPPPPSAGSDTPPDVCWWTEQLQLENIFCDNQTRTWMGCVYKNSGPRGPFECQIPNPKCITPSPSVPSC